MIAAHQRAPKGNLDLGISPSKRTSHIVSIPIEAGRALVERSSGQCQDSLKAGHLPSLTRFLELLRKYFATFTPTRETVAQGSSDM
jgi:hypothetical protein